MANMADPFAPGSLLRIVLGNLVLALPALALVAGVIVTLVTSKP